MQETLKRTIYQAKDLSLIGEGNAGLYKNCKKEYTSNEIDFRGKTNIYSSLLVSWNR